MRHCIFLLHHCLWLLAPLHSFSFLVNNIQVSFSYSRCDLRNRAEPEMVHLLYDCSWPPRLLPSFPPLKGHKNANVNIMNSWQNDLINETSAAGRCFNLEIYLHDIVCSSIKRPGFACLHNYKDDHLDQEKYAVIDGKESVTKHDLLYCETMKTSVHI